MKIHVDRDSVCAADDIDSHARWVVVPDEADLERLVASVLAVFPLPNIQGGRATWCVTSGRPIAVIAQQWAAPKMVSWRPRGVAECEHQEGNVCLYFRYVVQHDPDVVLDVLRRTAVD